MRETSKKYIIYGLIVTLVLCIGFSVAYFTGKIRGEGEKIVLKVGSVNVIFNDTT